MCSFDGATVGVDTRAPPTAEAEIATDGPYGRGKQKLYPDVTPHTYAIILRHGVLRRRDRCFARAAHGRALRAPAGRDRMAGERARHTHVAAPFVRVCVSLAERTDRARHSTITRRSACHRAIACPGQSVRHEHFVPLVWTRDAPRAPEWPDPEAPPWDARSGQVRSR